MTAAQRPDPTKGGALFRYEELLSKAQNLKSEVGFQVESTSNTPVVQSAKRIIKRRGWYVACPQKVALTACSSGRRAGCAVRQFDSLVLGKLQDVVLRLCAQEEVCSSALHRSATNQRGHRLGARLPGERTWRLSWRAFNLLPALLGC